MPSALRPETRVDRGLRVVQRRTRRRSVAGGSRGWFWVFVAVWGIRRLRRLIGSEPVVVYRAEIEPGHAVRISHLTETYAGKRVRRR
ncbi:MAG TPA: hypothetical protein VKD21_06590 [Acidimicrobiales bacterium]|nr:hypothetical protein [Acidimicrobiales bacterium]